MPGQLRMQTALVFVSSRPHCMLSIYFSILNAVTLNKDVKNEKILHSPVSMIIVIRFLYLCLSAKIAFPAF